MKNLYEEFDATARLVGQPLSLRELLGNMLKDIDENFKELEEENRFLRQTVVYVLKQRNGQSQQN